MIPVQISVAEALARMTKADPVTVWFEPTPSTGITHVAEIERAGLVDMLSRSLLFESGKHGQASDMGVNTNFTHKVHGRGILFVQTRPECRRTDEQLAESVERRHAENIFSRAPTH